MIRTGLTTIAVITMAGMFAQSALTAPAEDLGKVHFETSCKPDAQQHFDQAMLYQHSFWYRASQKSFEDALKADPECAIAYWGIALSLLYNPHVAPPVKNLAEGAAALEKGKAVTAKTQRERDYIDALSAMYADYGKVDHRTRVLAYLKAMEQLAQRYPDDDEAQIYYALALNVAASPSDKTLSNQLKGTQILEPIWARQPEHPGVAHYLIHLYDTPALADRGIEAARRYSKIAPAAAHAQHMPSHIFTRVGYWRDSVESNRQSARVDGDRTGNSPHAYDYMVYAQLQLGQDKAAAEVLSHAARVASKPDNLAGAYAYAAMPARLALERGAWAEAAKLPLDPAANAYPWSKYPQAEAVNAFARGVGAAMSGDAAAAGVEVARLQSLRDTAKDRKIGYWAEQIDIQAEVVRGLASCAAAKADECVAILRAAADREDA